MGNYPASNTMYFYHIATYYSANFDRTIYLRQTCISRLDTHYQSGNRFMPQHAEFLGEFNEGHKGVTKCRERAKQSVWWPGLSKQIENLLESVTSVLKRDKPNSADDTIWRARTYMANCRLRSLWAEQFKLSTVVDYLSAFVDIAKFNNTSSASIVNNLK